jgi:cardiolipin synthase A/B
MTAQKAPPRHPGVRVALITASLTALVGLIALNLISSEKRLKQAITSPYGTRDPEFRREMGNLFGPAIVEGNRVTALENGAAIFPAMLAAIRKAQRSINFETYIYWSGRVGSSFAEALAERATAGVATHLILDAVGSGKIDKRALATMRAAGVEIEMYHSLRWYQLDRINNRTHRKLLIVDGKIGFTGGVGIADKWDGDADGPEHWRDSHFQLEGPAVAEMQATFVDHWLASRGVFLDGPAYFPALAAAGSMAAQMVRSSVEDGAESIHLMYLLSIAAARRSVWLSSAYFVPDDLAIEALVAARRRGVDVQIMVPGSHIDTAITRAASRSRWGRLLEAGIPIYEFQPTMFHCKVLVVDDIWTSVGSTNFDNRSFRLNDEANLNVFDGALAQQESATFVRDRARARRVTLGEWRHRSRGERVKEWFADLIGAEL